MIKPLKNIGSFGRNIIIVFLGTSLANFLNLLYQLLLAHRLEPEDFSAFNSLLSIFMLVSIPFGTLQAVVAKYSAEFKAVNQPEKIRVLISGVFKKTAAFAALALVFFSYFSFYILDKLKIPSSLCGYLLAFLIGFSLVTPVLLGGLQGMELFGWFIGASLISTILKLALAFWFVAMGFKIAGALGAFVISALLGLLISYFPLRRFISFRAIEETVDFKEIFLYLFPVAASFFCFSALISSDMILVKYYFSPQDSGFYSLAQMAGKIFLFLPGAISIVMFPKTSGLNAQNNKTAPALKKSLFYAGLLCLIAALIYNLFPEFILKTLTGKALPEPVVLGRLFSVSMSFFALLFVLISYFLSIRDMRFIKYLAIFTLLQLLAVIFMHRSLIQIQLILCINAILLFFIHLILVKETGTVLVENHP